MEGPLRVVKVELMGFGMSGDNKDRGDIVERDWSWY